MNDPICTICGYPHPEPMPHVASSQKFQSWFFRANGRIPTLRDAAAHCTEEVREAFYFANHKVDGSKPDDEVEMTWSRSA